jgi:hypothetical protein
LEKVTRVQVRESFKLELEFDSGERRISDARPYLEKGVSQQLKDPQLFAQAYVAFGTAYWPGNLDIAPETLYDCSSVIEMQSSE